MPMWCTTTPAPLTWKRIRAGLDAFDIVLAGRYSEWEYYNSDHAFIAGRKAAEAARAITLNRLSVQPAAA
jgi:hypothetical protein